MKFGRKNKQNFKGKLIVIDGVDGSGKGTQTTMLLETLKAEGYQCEVIDFPQYGQKSAGMVEEYLNGKYGPVDPYSSSVFYAVDRFDASFKLRSWLEAGKIVVSNRYVTASAGHQGGKILNDAERIKYFKWLDNLEYSVFKIPKPDLNILLHVPAEVAQKLVDKKNKAQRAYAGGKKRDLHEADLNHLKQAEKVFLEIAELFPNTKMVECVEKAKLLNPQQVHNKVWNLVRRIVLKTNRQAGIVERRKGAKVRLKAK
jgi:dTMP kinase